MPLQGSSRHGRNAKRPDCTGGRAVAVPALDKPTFCDPRQRDKPRYTENRRVGASLRQGGWEVHVPIFSCQSVRAYRSRMVRGRKNIRTTCFRQTKSEVNEINVRISHLKSDARWNA